MSSLYSKNVFYLFYPFIDKLYTVVLCWLVITDGIFLLLLCPLQSNPYLHTLHTDKTYKKVNIVIWCQSSNNKKSNQGLGLYKSVMHCTDWKLEYTYK